MKGGNKYPLRDCVAIDVDGTLLVKGRLNTKLAEWASKKRAEGSEVILWSAQGKAHAEEVARRFGITDNFSVIISKPGYIVDDMGWSWIKYTKRIEEIPE